jgi:predicted RNA-binding Zn ribbon-like protein
MDFIRYAESGAALVNADLFDVPALTRYLDGREWLHDQCTEKDTTALRRFQKELRPVFEASGERDVPVVLSGLNALMERHPVTPMISDHDVTNLHLHVANRAASVSELLIGEALLGLATLVCDLGPTRLGVCAAERCTHVYVDTSPNQSRRYCSERCSSRANVAAYRARQKAATA